MTRIAWALALVLTTLLFGTVDASAAQFKHAVYYRAGQRPYQVIASQFTPSGNVDLALANWLSDQVCILLGNGDGTFQKQRCFSAPAPIAVASGDFNEDGKSDLAVVEFGGTGLSSLQFFLGEGDGTFHPGTIYVAGIRTSFLAAADFNGDGHLDLAVPDSGTGGKSSILVFLGTGKGRLKKPARYGLGGGPAAIAAADLNGDHHPDLAVTQFGTGSVAIFLNDGTGHFKKPVSYSAGGGGGAVDVKIADLRNNGKQDLVVANLSQGMVALLNKGNGTFGKPDIYRPCGPNCQPPEACVIADFNLDGKLDAACATQALDSYLFYGHGNGKFGPPIRIKDTIQNQGGYSIAAGDFNHDGAPDLAIPIQNKGKVAVLLNTK